MNTSTILNVRETSDETCASLENIECIGMVRITTATVRVKRYRLVQSIDTVRDQSSTPCQSKEAGRTCKTRIPNNRHRRGSPRHLDAELELELEVSQLAYGSPSSLAFV